MSEGVKTRRLQTRVPAWLGVPWGIRDVVMFGVAWFGIQVVLMLLVVAVAPFVPGVPAFLHAVRSGQVAASFALDLLDAGVGFGLVGWYLRRYGVGWSTAGWRRVSVVKAAGWLLGILLLFVVGANVILLLVSVLVPGFDANQAQQNEFIGAAKSHYNVALVALVLLPPVLEETIFRGFLFPALAKRMGMVWGAVVSSAVFGLAHWQANISVYTFVLGLLLCFMYVRLRSIVPGMALHMINNLFAFLAVAGK